MKTFISVAIFLFFAFSSLYAQETKETQLAGIYKIGTGTGSNYPTLQSALQILHDNGASGPVVFELMDSYSPENENFPVYFLDFPGASETNTLTVKPALNADIIIEAATATSLTALFTIVDASHIIIDGSHNYTDTKNITLINTHQYNDVAVIGMLTSETGGEDIVVKNCNIIGAGKDYDNFGIFNGHFTNVTVSNNSIKNVYTGILSDGGSELIFENNEIGSESDSETVSLGIGLQSASDFVVRKNYLYNLLSEKEHDIYGVFTEGSTGNITVSGNTVSNIIHTGTHAAQALAFMNVDAEALNIFNNHISGVASDSRTDNFPCGIAILCPDMTSGISILNNTIFMPENDTFGIGLGSSNVFAAGIAIGAGSGIKMRNNIISNLLGERDGSTEITYGVAIVTDLLTSPFSEIDDNVYFAEGDWDVSVLAWTNFGAMDIEDWRAWTSGDSHSYFENPQFLSNDDLHLHKCSPAVAHGTPETEITYDISGKTRHSLYPSIGAYEYEMIQACDVNQILPMKAIGEVFLQWIPGNGCHSAIFMKQGDYVISPPTPENGESYAPAQEYGYGDQIGSSGWYCVGNIEPTEYPFVTFEGNLNETYTIFVAEYYGSLGNEVYLTETCANNPILVYPNDGSNISYQTDYFIIYPSITTDFLTINNLNSPTYSAEITDIAGRNCGRYLLQNTESNTLDVRNLQPGLYFISLTADGIRNTLKFIKQ